MSKSDNFKRNDLIFILNTRKIKVKSGTNATELKTLVGGTITDEELLFLQNFNDVMNNKSFIEKLKSEGRMKKTYPTEKKYIENYIRSLPGKIHPYDYESSSKSDRTVEMIAKIHFFYHALGVNIPIKTISLSNEQKSIMEKENGIIVVNSGPGTGKTTTAVHRALRWEHEGIIIVSFTNSAVENVYEMLSNYIDDKDKIGKENGNAENQTIYLTTIDSLTSLAGASKKSDFDARIESAIKASNMCFGKFFMNLSGEIKYKHIIVDEAQDLDKLRYDLIMKIYNEIGGKSITFLGDPRQRMNSKAGGPFEEMIRNKNHFLVETSISYRFQNKKLLALCNDLSAIRKKIHVKLDYAGRDTSDELIGQINCDDVTEMISQLVESGVAKGSIGIISPIVRETGTIASRIKKQYELIKNGLAQKSIAVSDSIDPNCVYQSSIQSSKGLEFDHVFFVGCSNFPSYMNQVYGDINDGISINFVANTRARKMLYYVTSEDIPNNVSRDLVVSGGTVTVQRKKEGPDSNTPVSIDTYDINPHDYKTMEDNMSSLYNCPIQILPEFKFPGSSKLILMRYEIISSSLSLLEGKTIIQNYKGKSIQFNKEIAMAKFLGAFRDTECVLKDDNTIHLKEDSKEDISLVCSPYLCEQIEKHRTFAKIMNGRESVLTDMDEISNVSMKILAVLERYKEHGTFYQKLFKFSITAPMIVNSKIALVFTESIYLAMYIQKKLGIEVIVISLSNGDFYKLKKTNYSLKRYEYHVKFLYSLHVHITLMKRGCNFQYSLSGIDENRPHLVIDTEFSGRTYNKSNTIYDISLINISNPYLSLSTYLMPDKNNFRVICGDMNLNYSDFINCPTHVDFYRKFRLLYNGKRPVIHYYNAADDLSILYEGEPSFVEKISQARKAIMPDIDEYLDGDTDNEFFAGTIDYSKIPVEIEKLTNEIWKFDKTFESKYFSHVDDYRRGVYDSNSQSDVYAIECNRNISLLRHINLHTAFSDALLLMEIVIGRYFKIE